MLLPCYSSLVNEFSDSACNNFYKKPRIWWRRQGNRCTTALDNQVPTTKAIFETIGDLHRFVEGRLKDFGSRKTTCIQKKSLPGRSLCTPSPTEDRLPIPTPTETSNQYSPLFVNEELDCISRGTLSSEENCRNSQSSSTDSVDSGKFNTFHLCSC